MKNGERRAQGGEEGIRRMDIREGKRERGERRRYKKRRTNEEWEWRREENSGKWTTKLMKDKGEEKDNEG
jgi:hypothetical protein